MVAAAIVATSRASRAGAWAPRGGDPMHPNAQTLQRFYTAFAQLDHATMAACYAPNATFDDEAFSLKGRDEVGGMWRMLCTATKKPGAAEHWKLEFSGIDADAQGEVQVLSVLGGQGRDRDDGLWYGDALAVREFGAALDRHVAPFVGALADAQTDPAVV
eukprot:gene46690-62455_t